MNKVLFVLFPLSVLWIFRNEKSWNCRSFHSNGLFIIIVRWIFAQKWRITHSGTAQMRTTIGLSVEISWFLITGLFWISFRCKGTILLVYQFIHIGNIFIYNFSFALFCSVFLIIFIWWQPYIWPVVVASLASVRSDKVWPVNSRPLFQFQYQVAPAIVAQHPVVCYYRRFPSTHYRLWQIQSEVAIVHQLKSIFPMW